MSESLGARAVQAGWNYETCGWQSGLSLSLSPYEAYLIIITMILSSFAEHIYSALVARANCGVSSPSPCQYLLSLLWKRRGWPRLSTEGGGERQRSTESFIFLIHLRAFPRLASSGQHKPVLWAANQATAHEDDWDALAKFLYLCKEEDDCCGLLNYRYSSCGCSTRQKKKFTQWNVTKISDDIGLLESFSHNTTADYIYDTLKSL